MGQEALCRFSYTCIMHSVPDFQKTHIDPHNQAAPPLSNVRIYAPPQKGQTCLHDGKFFCVFAKCLLYLLSRITTLYITKMVELFNGLISSKTRIRILMRFFFNPGTSSYLRELAKEFDVSTNAVREELAQLTRAGFLKSKKNGRQVNYLANEQHPLFPELKSMVAKVMGIDQVIDGIVSRLGELERAYLIDDYAEGKDTGIVDLLLVGSINMTHLADLSGKTEKYIKRKIRSLVVSRREFDRFEDKLRQRPHVLIWQAHKKPPSGV